MNKQSVILYTSVNGNGNENNILIAYNHSAAAGNYIRFFRRDSNKYKFLDYKESEDANNPGTTDFAWNTIVGSWDGWDTYPEVFVNGGVPGTRTEVTTGTVTAMNTSTSQLIIGSQAAGSQWLDGFLDEFKIYDHALSVGEKQDIYTDYEGCFL